MRATELRIGNYYMPTDRTKKPLEITADDILAFSLGAIYGKPIPLTEERLLKIGKRLNKWEWDIQGEIFRFVHIKSWGLVYTGGMEDKAFSVEIKHLHHLQNFYFTLRNEELKINIQ